MYRCNNLTTKGGYTAETEPDQSTQQSNICYTPPAPPAID